MKDKVHMSLSEYSQAVKRFQEKGGQQINLLGGELLLHPDLFEMLKLNKKLGIKTTIYTNGCFVSQFKKTAFSRWDAKLRVSIYGPKDVHKGLQNLQDTEVPYDANFMVSRTTTLTDLLDTAKAAEEAGCKVFFISSLRELDNSRKEFFDDTDLTMPVIEYKELVHKFLWGYDGNMEIHVSKRGVFESTVTPPNNRCLFANYIIGGKIIQCPYDLINEKYQTDYDFDTRFCQHNNTCLMSKVVYRRKR